MYFIGKKIISLNIIMITQLLDHPRYIYNVYPKYQLKI